MEPKKPSLLARFVVEQFKRGAIVAHFGYEDEDRAMQRVGLKSAHRAVQILDTEGDDGRLALVPLLEDPDWGIRVLAAGYLVKVIPERALAVLQEIDEQCPTRARMTASHMLWDHKHGYLKL
jgi:hypothetical protein